jgi:hypothetical protein
MARYLRLLRQALLSTSSLVRVKPQSVHTAASGDRIGRGFSLPPPFSMPFSTTCNEAISSPLPSSAGVIDPRHLLQCYGALLHDHFGRLHDKLHSFMGPLKGGSILLMLTSLVTHTLSALPAAWFLPFHTWGGSDRSGRWPQGVMPVSGMHWGAPGGIAG